jgi:hypothetical protein
MPAVRLGCKAEIPGETPPPGAAARGLEARTPESLAGSASPGFGRLSERGPLTGTYREHTSIFSNPRATRKFAHAGILADPCSSSCYPPVIPLFPGPESWDINNFVLISVGPARGRARMLGQGAVTATRAAGRPQFPIRGGAFPILGRTLSASGVERRAKRPAPAGDCRGAGGNCYSAAGDRRRTGLSPTRSGPEGSSRNEFGPGSFVRSPTPGSGPGQAVTRP